MPGHATNQNMLLYSLEGVDVCLTTAALTKQLGLPRKSVTQACAKLLARGLVDRVERGCYQLTEAGRQVVENKVSLTSAALVPKLDERVYKDSMRTRIWRAMRLKKKFTIADLTKLATRDEKQGANNVQQYCKALRAVGYLRKIRNTDRALRFCLVIDNGPIAPIFRKKRGEVFDPNTKEVIPWTP